MYYTLQIALGATSILMALGLVYLFTKVYRTQKSLYLLGLPFGFLFLALSYLFLGLHLAYPNVQALSGSLMWLRVITQTGGFILIALSYYMSNKTQRTTKYSFSTIALILVLAVTSIFCLLFAINPPGLTYVYTVNDLFTVVNLGLLSYVLIFLARKRKLSNGASGLLSAPIAFTALWLGQFTFLIWDLGRLEIFLLGSQIARIIALAIMLQIYYIAIREAPKSDFG